MIKPLLYQNGGPIITVQVSEGLSSALLYYYYFFFTIVVLYLICPLLLGGE